MARECLVFISYSHNDKEWLERLRTHLRPLERELTVVVWDDTKIVPGAKWREEIAGSISAARVAILLISADFLASDFISKNELPPLLAAAQERGTLILPLILSPCSFVRTKNLSSFQAVNNPSEPLIGISKVQQEAVLDKVAQQIESVLEAPPAKDPQEWERSLTQSNNTGQELLLTYYRCIADECRHLPLGTIAAEFISKRDEDRISLAAVYVRLDVQNATREDPDMSARAWALRLAIGDERVRTPLLYAISNPANRFNVVLGEAGSGKTSFINYLTYLLASRASDLPEAFQDLLPLHLVLREVAAKFIPVDAQRGSAEMLWKALLNDMRHHLGEESAGVLFTYVQHRMIREGAVVLLDGLDEVPEANRRRTILIEAVRDLANVLEQPRTRFLVTARPYAYVDPQWQLEGFSPWSLAPFNDIQKQEFISRWYKAIRPSFGWSEDTAESKAAKLEYALRYKPYLGELAGRPLFLTLMAALHSNRGQLPEDRAELYEETVRLMLSRWQRAREVRDPDGGMVVEPGITEALRVGEPRLRAALEALAYSVHQKQRPKIDAHEGPADISKLEVMGAFEELLDEVKLRTLLRYLEDRAGLLIERKGGVFAFPHRSFQEYLAACYLAEEPDFPDSLVHHVNADYTWWREILLLAVGKARLGSLRNAVSIVTALVPESPADASIAADLYWQNSILAGEAILELGLPEKAQGKLHYEALIRRVRQWLLKIVEEERLMPAERLKAGDLLGHLEDPRRGVGIVVQGNSALPDIDWVTIPAGAFLMGSSSLDEMAQANEFPQHRVFLPSFCISRYPVTNRQFSLFIEAGAYRSKTYWNQVGWEWVNGGEADFTPIPDEQLRERYRKWMARRSGVRRTPGSWGDPSFGQPTRPVIGVNWYEAMAYAKWLEELYQRQEGARPRQIGGRGFRIRLPTEAEWEKAARGTEGNIWPWGNELGRGLANTKEEDLGKTSPVGIFTSGASPFGVLDMVGNVWEWTVTRWGYRTYEVADYNYPYGLHDGRDDESGTHIRVVRGSSWFGNLENFGRCAYRGWGFSFNSSSFSGFRVAIAFPED